MCFIDLSYNYIQRYGFSIVAKNGYPYIQQDNIDYCILAVTEQSYITHA